MAWKYYHHMTISLKAWSEWKDFLDELDRIEDEFRYDLPK